MRKLLTKMVLIIGVATSSLSPTSARAGSNDFGKFLAGLGALIILGQVVEAKPAPKKTYRPRYTVPHRPYYAPRHRHQYKAPHYKVPRPGRYYRPAPTYRKHTGWHRTVPPHHSNGRGPRKCKYSAGGWNGRWINDVRYCNPKKGWGHGKQHHRKDKGHAKKRQGNGDRHRRHD